MLLLFFRLTFGAQLSYSTNSGSSSLASDLRPLISKGMVGCFGRISVDGFDLPKANQGLRLYNTRMDCDAVGRTPCSANPCGNEGTCFPTGEHSFSGVLSKMKYNISFPADFALSLSLKYLDTVSSVAGGHRFLSSVIDGDETLLDVDKHPGVVLLARAIVDDDLEMRHKLFNVSVSDGMFTAYAKLTVEIVASTAQRSLPRFDQAQYSASVGENGCAFLLIVQFISTANTSEWEGERRRGGGGVVC
ncbi:unnamed protein product [Toxocara canis]|uniref:Cadherin domain-containing protein n=1 Tax=Toxocara canis TaxID=6265 RepID=A0A183U5T1_TOXCA|nr:unnamed protein product [Toxocara canis]